MIQIIPAILPKHFHEIEQELQRLQGVAPLIQIDLVKRNVLLGQSAMPLWQEFDFEFDIMLPDPAAAVQSCIDMGAARIVVHVAHTAPEALALLQPLRGGELPLLVGMALGSHESALVLKHFEGLYDYVQVMGIETIGSQGQPFDERCITLIQELRAMYPELAIQVDGAASGHIEELVAAGANRLVVGSAIINADDPAAKYKTLYTRANVAR